MPRPRRRPAPPPRRWPRPHPRPRWLLPRRRPGRRRRSVRPRHRSLRPRPRQRSVRPRHRSLLRPGSRPRPRSLRRSLRSRDPAGRLPRLRRARFGRPPPRFGHPGRRPLRRRVRRPLRRRVRCLPTPILENRARAAPIGRPGREPASPSPGRVPSVGHRPHPGRPQLLRPPAHQRLRRPPPPGHRLAGRHPPGPPGRRLAHPLDLTPVVRCPRSRPSVGPDSIFRRSRPPGSIPCRGRRAGPDAEFPAGR
jgi:hypothetical protein